MDVKITYNWLCEYLETDASAHEIQKYLSLCGPSVEKVEKRGMIGYLILKSHPTELMRLPSSVLLKNVKQFCRDLAKKQN